MVELEDSGVRVAVIGATGRTGARVVREAVQRGHHVHAMARRPDQVTDTGGNVQSCRADTLDPDSLTAALAGTDAVVSAVGIGTSRAPTRLYSDGITTVLSAMAANAVSRLAVVSAGPVGPRAEQPFLERRIVMPVLERFFGATYADMRRMEAILASSSVDWVALRPPRLISKPAHGTYRLDTRPLPAARQITHADLARALLDTLTRPALQQQPVYVAN